MRKKLVIIIPCTILMLVFMLSATVLGVRSVPATGRLRAFAAACEAGDTLAMEHFAPSVYSMLSGDTINMLGELGIDDILTSAEESAVPEAPSIQSLVLSHSMFSPKIVLTFTDTATASLSVTSPDMRKCIQALMDSAAEDNAYTAETLYSEIERFVESQTDMVTYQVDIPMERLNGTSFLPIRRY
ncbi:MAG: hypothetical protein J1F42_14470 [Lachnospiraceae bacterium]|nr:hypothetical protein [Lachnospiraceae bacterium]